MEKTEKPTAKKLREARRRGEVPKSRELGTAAVVLSVAGVLVATGAGAASRQSIGTAVFGGMVVATVVSVIAVPMLYFVVQWVAEKIGGGGRSEA